MSREISHRDATMTIGQRVAKIRSNKRLTQSAFGASLGLSQNYISMVESDTKNLSDPVILLIEHLYGISRPWLLTGEGPMVREISERSFDYDMEHLGGGATGEERDAVRYGGETVLGKIITLLREMSEEDQREILKNVQDKKLLREIAEERRKLKGG